MADMTHEQAHDMLRGLLHEAHCVGTCDDTGHLAFYGLLTDEFLSAPPEVLAAALGGKVRLITGVAARVEIVLPPQEPDA